MKTYILSVNTLTWNFTLERHDNCAPCLGLILPIRWVTPPPNFLIWSVSLMVLFLLCLRIWFVFKSQLIFMIYFTMLIWLLSDIYTSVLSSTAFTYSYVFLVESFELSECDRTLISLCFLSQTLSVQIICILLKLSNVFSASLSAEDTETNIKSVTWFILIDWNPEKPEWPSDKPGGRGNVGQLWVCCMLATCPSDVNRQGHLRNCAVPHTSL